MKDELPIARIEMTVQQFNEIGTDQYTTASLKLIDTPDHPLPSCVKYQDDGTGKKCLMVSAKVILEFILAPASEFMPLGIAFEKGGGALDPDGLLDFPVTTRLSLNSPREGTQHVLRITDEHVDVGNKREFDVIIQRLSDQALGLIDPEEKDTNQPHH